MDESMESVFTRTVLNFYPESSLLSATVLLAVAESLLARIDDLRDALISLYTSGSIVALVTVLASIRALGLSVVKNPL